LQTTYNSIAYWQFGFQAVHNHDEDETNLQNRVSKFENTFKHQLYLEIILHEEQSELKAEEQ